MKVSNLITSLVAAAASSAATPLKPPVHRPKPPREDITKTLLHAVSPFEVTDFTSSAVPPSYRIDFGFNLKTHPNASKVHCEYLGSAIPYRNWPGPEFWCYPVDGSETTEEQEKQEHKQEPSPYLVDSQQDLPGLGRVSFQWEIAKPFIKLDEGRPTDPAAELRIKRNVFVSNERNITDEAVFTVPAKHIVWWPGLPWKHNQVYTGPKNFTVEAYRYRTDLIA
ncbi:hypothetical protein V8F20_003097 [Naviculisporaceae sp. PSN 640]